MPQFCAVAGCYNVRGKNLLDSEGNPINYFSLPDPVKQKDRYDKFVDLCQFKQDCEGHCLYICSVHFSAEDIIGNRFLKPTLQKSALPCRNLPEVKRRETVVSQSLCPGPPHDDCEESVTAGLTLTEIIFSVVLPEGLWCSKLCGDYLAFFELSVDETQKPIIVRSVTIDCQLHPTIYIGGSLVKLCCKKPLCTVQDVNSLLLTVSSLSPDVSSFFTTLTDLMNEAIAAHKHLNHSEESQCLSTDHTYASNLEAKDKSLHDHTYISSAAVHTDTGNTNIPENDTSLYLTTLMFLRSQCLLLSASTAFHRRYEPAFLRWCFLIYFHSPAAYRAIIETKCLVVPSECLLRRYSAPHAVQPGLHDVREQYLASVSESMTSLEKNVSVIVDEMYVKPEISYSDGKLSGFADNRPDAVAATTILTLMVQSLCGSFRDVVAFFPVYKLTGAEEAKYVRDTIMLIERSGLNTRCVVCDNSKVNQTMLREFNVEINDGITTGTAVHPVRHDQNLFFIIDPCHLIKCIRNNWLNRSVFCIDGDSVSVEHVRQLHSEDLKRDIKLAPKLNTKVLSPTNTEKQCVRSAVSLFSPSVTGALETYMALEPELFRDAAPTVEFMKRIYRFWCWTNIQSVSQGQNLRDVHRQPFRSVTDFRFQEMDQLKSWLVAWHNQAPANAKLTNDTYTAFCITLESLKCLIIQLLDDEQAQFVLTGRFQQDPLEERFAAHRQRAGCSYNPSALQFQQTEKKLAVVKSVTHSKNGNTARLERKAGELKEFWDNSVLPTAPKKCKVVTNHHALFYCVAINVILWLCTFFCGQF